LPTDARTLLSTPRTTNCTSTAGGEYLHFGLSNVINLLMKNYTDAGLDVNNITFSFSKYRWFANIKIFISLSLANSNI